MAPKIAVLLPKSDMFPTLALDFLNGFKLSYKGLKDSSSGPDLIVEGIGNAADDQLIRTAERMVLQENVDLTLSFSGNLVLEHLVQFQTAYKKPLIHLDLGGNLLRENHRSPYVLHHTMNLCQSSYAAGKLAAEKFGKKGALLASFYDGGYQLSFSFVKGYTDGGGEMVFNYVAPMDYKKESYEVMIRGLEASGADVAFTLFSYKEGAKVCKALGSSGLNGKIPFMAIPLLTDEYFNTENYQIKDVVSIASWSFDDESESMQSFLKIYRKEHSEPPNIFGLLGYEVGQLINYCLENEGKIPFQIGDFYRNKELETPRGTLVFNEYFDSYVKALKLRKFQYNQSKYHNWVIDNLESIPPQELYQEGEELPHSGWQNPYICT